MIITIGFGSWYCTISGSLRVLIDEEAQRAAGLFLGFENVGLAFRRFGDAGVNPRRAGIGEERRREALHLHAHAAHARFVQLFRSVIVPPPGPGLSGSAPS